ncbi:MAG: phosphoribosylglycinamide formyltransferase [Phycisphaerales bacterium]
MIAPGPRPARLAVFVSGGGRTLLNLHDAAKRGDFNGEVALVVSSAENSGAERARSAGLPVRVWPGRLPRAELGELLREQRIDLVVLAGYLKLLPIPAGFEERVLNIHPALLPAFGGPGMHGRHVHEAVIRASASVSGCTVHFCDEHYDTGPIVLQRSCPVCPGDTPEALAARVFAEELVAYPAALRQLLGPGARKESP